MSSIDNNEGMQLKNAHLAQNVQDIFSNDEYSYNVIPLNEFWELPYDPQNENNFQTLNINDVYQNREMEIEQLKADVQIMSNSSSRLTNLEEGNKIIQNLNSNGASIPSNSGESIGHSKLNNRVSIPQVNIMQSGK